MGKSVGRYTREEKTHQIGEFRKGICRGRGLQGREEISCFRKKPGHPSRGGPNAVSGGGGLNNWRNKRGRGSFAGTEKKGEVEIILRLALVVGEPGR